jgi:hypothetical protein
VDLDMGFQKMQRSEREFEGGHEYPQGAEL